MGREIHHKMPDALTEDLGANKQQALDNFTLKLLLALEDDERFADLIRNPTPWLHASQDRNRGCKDIIDKDGSVEVSSTQQCRILQLFLDTIASVCPVISKTYVTQQAECLDDIWRRLRVHYGIRKTGGSILQFGSIRKVPTESNEAYWERLYSFIEDNLLSPSSTIQHFGKVPVKRESFTPTLHNLLVVLWLQGIDPSLPEATKLRFATELRDHTTASIRDEISEAIPSLLQNSDNDHLITVAKVYANPQKSQSRFQPSNPVINKKICSLCEVCGKKPTDHFLKDCPFLLTHDKVHFNKNPTNRFKSRLVEVDEEENENDTRESQLVESHKTCSISVRKVDIEGSPVLNAFYGNEEVKVILDYGTTGDMISLRMAKKLRLPISVTQQTAKMADGGTPMTIVGETHVFFTVGHHQLKFSALVAEHVSGDILGGVPFHRDNDIHVRIKSQQVMIGDCCMQKYTPFQSTHTDFHQARTVAIIRNDKRVTVLPNESMKIQLPSDFAEEEYIAIEPREQSKSLQATEWLKPSIVPVDNGEIALTNSSYLPVLVASSEQVCNIRRTETFDLDLVDEMSVNSNTIQSNSGTKVKDSQDSPSGDSQKHSVLEPTSSVLNRKGYSDLPIPPGCHYSDNIDINSKLSNTIISELKKIHRKYDDVFNPAIGCYNGASGPFEARVNMGPTLPPQRKGHCPQYAHSDKQILQDKFDYLDSQGVTSRPSDLGITIENVNPSFLVRKKSGGWRTVTSFGEIAQYCKPQPALMSRVDVALRHIGGWTHIITTDLSDAYYQIRLALDSIKYCGTCTPFKGVRCFTRCCMGMPGSETALEELIALVLGDLIAEGRVTKVADDLYCGGDSQEEVVEIWSTILERLLNNGLHLSAAKTNIFPDSCTILGWIWTNGTLSASTHRLTALQTCSPPATVKGLRSFIGAYKFISKVLPNHCDVLHPLEITVGKRNSREKIEWTDQLTHAFKSAQNHLSTATTIHMPRPSDQLQIVTDAATSKLGLAATLYAIRKGKPLICGFFNAKMTDNQTRWLPCESEALCIHMAVTFFAPYIIENKQRTIVLTDSKPCVQAYQKILRGQFSNSARVMTFISSLCNYGVELLHVKGSDNLLSDFTSRNTIECTDISCQICKFVAESEYSVVRELDISDIARESSIDPFLNRAAWHNIQRSCSDLQRVHAQLTQGTRPSRKLNNLRDVRTYLRNALIARDGLLIVKSTAPFSRQKELIVVPRSVAHGIVMALHLRLSHASANELQKVIKRHFYMLNRDDVTRRVTASCEVCASLKTVPKIFKEQSTSVPPSTIGRNFSADVVRRNKQKILILREDTSAFTKTMIVNDETKDTLRDGLIELSSGFRSMNAPSIKIRTDPASAFRSLTTPQLDKTLSYYGLIVEIGNEKNTNKNPIAEKSISELHFQLTKLQPRGGAVSSATLAIATSNMNSQLRQSGLSSLEIWTQRDQITGSQLPIIDRNIIKARYDQRLRSHHPSAKYKGRGKTKPSYPDLSVGDLVYLLQDRDKTKARDRYLVIGIDHPKCVVQKFCGAQLRSRVYTVDIADCIVLKSNPDQLHLNTVSDSESSGDNNFNDSDSNHSDIHPGVHNESDDLSNSDDPIIENGENQSPYHSDDVDGPVQVHNSPIRVVRRRRPPPKFNDYVSGSEFSSDDD